MNKKQTNTAPGTVGENVQYYMIHDRQFRFNPCVISDNKERAIKRAILEKIRITDLDYSWAEMEREGFIVTEFNSFEEVIKVCEENDIAPISI